MRLLAALCLCVLPVPPVAAQTPMDSTALVASREELRRAIGAWDVVTEFLNLDGSIARREAGSYEFAWSVPDRVISGRSELPGLQQRSAILFYVDEASRTIEMVSVGADGRLWVMTGPLGGSTRSTAPYRTGDGGTAQLRFTSFNVTWDRFESRMEYSTDGGSTWLPGNHQVFVRRM